MIPAISHTLFIEPGQTLPVEQVPPSGFRFLREWPDLSPKTIHAWLDTPLKIHNKGKTDTVDTSLRELLQRAAYFPGGVDHMLLFGSMLYALLFQTELPEDADIKIIPKISPSMDDMITWRDDWGCKLLKPTGTLEELCTIRSHWMKKKNVRWQAHKECNDRFATVTFYVQDKPDIEFLLVNHIDQEGLYRSETPMLDLLPYVTNSSCNDTPKLLGKEVDPLIAIQDWKEKKLVPIEGRHFGINEWVRLQTRKMRGHYLESAVEEQEIVDKLLDDPNGLAHLLHKLSKMRRNGLRETDERLLSLQLCTSLQLAKNQEKAAEWIDQLLSPKLYELLAALVQTPDEETGLLINKMLPLFLKALDEKKIADLLFSNLQKINYQEFEQRKQIFDTCIERKLLLLNSKDTLQLAAGLLSTLLRLKPVAEEKALNTYLAFCRRSAWELPEENERCVLLLPLETLTETALTRLINHPDWGEEECRLAHRFIRSTTSRKLPSAFLLRAAKHPKLTDCFLEHFVHFASTLSKKERMFLFIQHQEQLLKQSSPLLKQWKDELFNDPEALASALGHGLGTQSPNELEERIQLVEKTLEQQQLDKTHPQILQLMLQICRISCNHFPNRLEESFQKALAILSHPRFKPSNDPLEVIFIIECKLFLKTLYKKESLSARDFEMVEQDIKKHPKRIFKLFSNIKINPSILQLLEKTAPQIFSLDTETLMSQFRTHFGSVENALTISENFCKASLPFLKELISLKAFEHSFLCIKTITDKYPNLLEKNLLIHHLEQAPADLDQLLFMLPHCKEHTPLIKEKLASLVQSDKLTNPIELLKALPLFPTLPNHLLQTLMLKALHACEKGASLNFLLNSCYPAGLEDADTDVRMSCWLAAFTRDAQLHDLTDWAEKTETIWKGSPYFFRIVRSMLKKALSRPLRNDADYHKIAPIVALTRLFQDEEQVELELMLVQALCLTKNDLIELANQSLLFLLKTPTKKFSDAINNLFKRLYKTPSFQQTCLAFVEDKRFANFFDYDYFVMFAKSNSSELIASLLAILTRFVSAQTRLPPSKLHKIALFINHAQDFSWLCDVNKGMHALLTELASHSFLSQEKVDEIRNTMLTEEEHAQVSHLPLNTVAQRAWSVARILPDLKAKGKMAALPHVFGILTRPLNLPDMLSFFELLAKMDISSLIDKETALNVLQLIIKPIEFFLKKYAKDQAIVDHISIFYTLLASSTLVTGMDCEKHTLPPILIKSIQGFIKQYNVQVPAWYALCILTECTPFLDRKPLVDKLYTQNAFHYLLENQSIPCLLRLSHLLVQTTKQQSMHFFDTYTQAFRQLNGANQAEHHALTKLIDSLLTVCKQPFNDKDLEESTARIRAISMALCRVNEQTKHTLEARPYGQFYSLCLLRDLASENEAMRVAIDRLLDMAFERFVQYSLYNEIGTLSAIGLFKKFPNLRQQFVKTYNEIKKSFPEAKQKELDELFSQIK